MMHSNNHTNPSNRHSLFIFHTLIILLFPYMLLPSPALSQNCGGKLVLQSDLLCEYEDGSELQGTGDVSLGDNGKAEVDAEVDKIDKNGETVKSHGTPNGSMGGKWSLTENQKTGEMTISVEGSLLSNSATGSFTFNPKDGTCSFEQKSEGILILAL